MPDTPASAVEAAFFALTPPMETTGIFTDRHTLSSPSKPITSASSLELLVTTPTHAHMVGNTAPEPR